MYLGTWYKISFVVFSQLKYSCPLPSNIKWAGDPRANLHLLKTRFRFIYFYLCKLFYDLVLVVQMTSASYLGIWGSTRSSLQDAPLMEENIF